MLEANPSAEKILQVAIEMLARKGYHATSTREIVEAAGVTKPMLYYYFGSKAGVCRRGFAGFRRSFFARLEGVLARDREPRETSGGLCLDEFRVHARPPRYELVLHEPLFWPERQQFKEDFDAVAAGMRELTGQLVQLGDRGRGGAARFEENFVMAIHGLIDAWHKTSICEGIELSPPVAEQIVNDLIVGFGAP